MSSDLLDPFGIFDKAGDPGTPSQSSSGYGALPSDLQKYFTDLAGQGSDVVEGASQYFSPMGLTPEEQMAQSMMDPSNIEASISQYLNPFRDIITQDINTAYGDEYSALKQQADEAGAFGGSRYRGGQSDLERARLDAIASAQSDQYNQAYNQYQQGIGNLLGFGGLERGVDMSQQMALPTALGFQGSLINPLLGNTTQTGAVSNPWSMENMAKIASGVGGAAAAFSDERLKENIKKVRRNKGLNIYEFNYKWSPKRYSGVLAQEVREVRPDAVMEHESGYLMVDYGKLGFSMELAA
jgi:hypothetical protein